MPIPSYEAKRRSSGWFFQRLEKKKFLNIRFVSRRCESWAMQLSFPSGKSGSPLSKRAAWRDWSPAGEESGCRWTVGPRGKTSEPNRSCCCCCCCINHLLANWPTNAASFSQLGRRGRKWPPCSTANTAELAPSSPQIGDWLGAQR